MATYSAYLNAMLRGSVTEGDEFYHSVVLEADRTYELELEADDPEADLDLYLTNEDGEVWYEDESPDSGAAVEIESVYTGINRIYVKSAKGSTDYTITIVEKEDEA